MANKSGIILFISIVLILSVIFCLWHNFIQDSMNTGMSDHLTMWQRAVVSTSSLVALILFSLFILFMSVYTFSLQHEIKNKIIKFTYLDQPRVTNYLILAFSQGILNPKVH